MTNGRRAPHRWRLLGTGARPGAWNMACDEAVLDAVGWGVAPPTVRFYAWDPPAVSLGRHQAEPDPAACSDIASLGLDWVRRPTGGLLVYHGPMEEELTYSLAARVGEPGLPEGLADAYRAIHEALARGLARLGLPVVLAPRAPARARAVSPRSRLACFAASVPYELGVDGRKLLGSAQRRSRQALLQHGSLPLAGDPAAIPTRIWPGSLDAGAVTNVSAAAGRVIGFASAAAALAAGIEESLNVRLVPGGLTRAERAGIRARLEPAERRTPSAASA